MKVSTVFYTVVITLLLLAILVRNKTMNSLFIAENGLPFEVEINKPNIVIQ